MPKYLYSAKNHDWDMTLFMAHRQLMIAQADFIEKALDTLFEENDISKGGVKHSALTSSMILSFCAVESFTNSIAFELSNKSDLEKTFCYESYMKERGIKDQVKNISNHLSFCADFGSLPFKNIIVMRNWRHSITHPKPYKIDDVPIDDTQEIHALHEPFHEQEYLKSVNLDNAKMFYNTAYEYVNFIKDKSGMEPRAQCVYEVL